MRPLPNDTVAHHSNDDSQTLHQIVEGTGEDARGPDTSRKARGTHEPERRCILSGEHAPRASLVRLAIGPDGQVLPDVRAKAPGRGAWIGVDRPALELAIAKGRLKGALARAFKTGGANIPVDLPQRIEDALQRNALDRLGLEARASTITTGSERIDEAGRKGQLHLLFHAADAAVDGNRKLDQSWRVGLDQEGSGRQGLVLSVPRTILSVALGRENVVHIGVIDARAATRVAAAIDRWHGFIGFAPTGWPCETPSQGSGPRGAFDGLNEGFGSD
ncbi:DUF448 domain-containing protein [Sphingomonas sp.]|uniref:DUF448 domain-containing protein n=1 Tax=Sphingomonas sp. TaxID=28214 RepID=UPI0025F3522D|nr:DUF448 domain-containing protein [Sphingomonas sp.]